MMQVVGSVKVDLARYADRDLTTTRNRVEFMLDGGIATGKTSSLAGALDNSSQRCGPSPHHSAARHFA